jgi:hypothetical protein
VAVCQNNLEVGDPLSGTNFSPIGGRNGFTYHLQELWFFSWLYLSKWEFRFGASQIKW